MKQCTWCKEYKDESEFHKFKRSKDGLYQYCKKCQNKKSCEWQKKHPEKCKENTKRWIENNREKWNEINRKNVKKWIKNNREKWNEYYREYYRKNHVPTTPITKKCILCGKEYTTVQYHQKYCSIKCKQKIKNRKKEKGSRKKLKWKILYSNPFDKIEEIHLHHINTKYVIPLPADIHNCYAGYHTRDDNEDLDYIIEQIYPSFDLIKNSLRKSFDN